MDSIIEVPPILILKDCDFSDGKPEYSNQRQKTKKSRKLREGYLDEDCV